VFFLRKIILGLLFASLTGCVLFGSNKAKLPLISNEQPKPLPPFSRSEIKAVPINPVKIAPDLIPGADLTVPTVNHSNAAELIPGQYSLNFDSSELPEVVKAIMTDMLGLSYVINPKVTGKVVLHSDSLTKEELLPTLHMILRLNGAALTQSGKIYHIEPLADALTQAAFSNTVGVQLRVFPVKNIAVQDAAQALKPLVPDSTILTVDSTRNILVASGSQDELARVADMVSIFDVDVLKGRSFGLFPLSHVAPLVIIRELEEVFGKTQKTEEFGQNAPAFFRFIAIDRLNAVMAITHQARYLKEIENWIARLDRVNTESTGGYSVYKVQHVDAVKLAATLNEFFSKSNKVAPTAARKAEQNEVIADVNLSMQNIKIMADEGNNSLLISSTAQEYEVIKPIIAQLDIMPLQVLVDATIVSVNLTDNLRYGIQWYLNHDSQGTATSGSSPSSVDLKAVAAAAVTGGFGYSFISNSGDIRAILSAEARANNINVISSPSLMVLNNQQASIQVGDEVPLRTSEQSTPIAGGTTNTPATITQSSTIQQRKTGVKLIVKPRVNANGLVTMDIEQSVDRAVPSTSSKIDSPTIQSRNINSSVAVQSGDTIVLGGLIDENNDASKTGIPLLQDIPLIGALFGSNGVNKARTELVVLITPRVVQSQQDAKSISTEFKRKLSGIYDVGFNDNTGKNEAPGHDSITAD
jgi:general secretion pathway protein D